MMHPPQNEAEFHVAFLDTPGFSGDDVGYAAGDKFPR